MTEELQFTGGTKRRPRCAKPVDVITPDSIPIHTNPMPTNNGSIELCVNNLSSEVLHKVNISTNPEIQNDPNRDYDYSELLSRIVDLNPENTSDHKTTRVPPPILGRIGTKKTSFTNVKEICDKIHRSPDHLMSFLSVELGTETSINNSQEIILKGRFQQTQIENVLKQYIREYVICKTCKSPDTEMQKENRINFIQCHQCHSRTSVSQVIKGYHAQIGKRKH